MARLIDADALVALIQQEPTDGMYTEEIVAVIAEQPTIEAAPVVHGRWINEMHGNSLNGTCSVCGYYDHAYAFSWKHCPDCGARMDGGVSDG